MPGIPPDCDCLAEKLTLLHLRLFPRPFSSHATECSGIVGEGTSVCRFKSVPTSVKSCGPISACATDTRIQPEYPVLFSMFSGKFCLRLKPYLVVKIASDVLDLRWPRVAARSNVGLVKDTKIPRYLDSNRRVGVWSLPRRWHILSIPLTTGRGIIAETCGLDDVFPPDDLGSRPEALC